MVLCLMVDCGNKTGKKGPDAEKVSFYRVPRVIRNQGEFTEELTSTRRRRWISAISREDLTDEKLESDRVCSKHFVSQQPAKDWDRHNIDWVPTLNLGHSKQLVKDPETIAERAGRLDQRRKRRQEIIDKEIAEKLQKINEPGQPVEEIFLAPEGMSDYQPVEQEDDQDGGPQTKETQTEVNCTLDAEAQTDEFCAVNAETQTDAFCAVTDNAETQTDEFEYMFKGTFEPFTEEYFVNSDNKVRFYTGLPGLDILKTTLEFISPFVTRRTRTLTAFQEFVMVLMKLRLNVPLQDLAYRFDISLSTVSRTFLAWMTVIDVRLSPLISWPEREDLWRTMPVCFQYSFGKKTTLIIDCFEIFIERPSNLLARAQTFSTYKHHNTVKVLIGITPQGSICFISKTWGGRTSDKFLTENCGFLNNLKPGDLVMADRGFTIEESLGLYQAKLAIPAFTRGKSQLDPFDVEKTRGIANVRIHVERVIGLLRQKYTILQSTLPIDFLMCSDKDTIKCPMVDRMVRVCSALTNLCPTIVPFD